VFSYRGDVNDSEVKGALRFKFDKNENWWSSISKTESSGIAGPVVKN
jgi:hypothetical protein